MNLTKWRSGPHPHPRLRSNTTPPPPFARKMRCSFSLECCGASGVFGEAGVTVCVHTRRDDVIIRPWQRETEAKWSGCCCPPVSDGEDVSQLSWFHLEDQTKHLMWRFWMQIKGHIRVNHTGGVKRETSVHAGVVAPCTVTSQQYLHTL